MSSNKPNLINWLKSDLAILLYISFAKILLHFSVLSGYGYHRDELATLEDALHLDWGFVAYPPLVPVVARLGLELFGLNNMGFRIFSTLVIALAAILAARLTAEMGGKRPAQILTLIAVAFAPINMTQSSVFLYVSFDYFWWVCLAYFLIRLINTDNPRYWLGIGAVIALGMLTKYTMAFWVLALVAGILISRRAWLRSPWLWGAALLSFLIFSPNLLWQINHQWISLDFLSSIHARDIRIGRTSGFLSGQLIDNNLSLMIPLWIIGLVQLLTSPRFKPYRIFAWMFMITTLAFIISQARSYYLAPAYPALLAAGAVWFEAWLSARSNRIKQILKWSLAPLLAVNILVIAAITMPLGPVNGPFWQLSSKVHDLFVEEIGWPEMVQTTARIYRELPPQQQVKTGIFAGNYGEAGAINIYGPQYGLPRVISTTNSFWLYGYGSQPPEDLIILGLNSQLVNPLFERCELLAANNNPYGVKNEESVYHTDIFLCHGLKISWQEFWVKFKNFG
ncbi:MAG: glycosyltransferase family 39 protein [Anaerolineae bacterium]|nr:glycosyltransferase family 39 protein [Anaerolineae bacterium]